MKAELLEIVPPDVVTSIGPVVAPGGTFTLIMCEVGLENPAAGTPLKVTDVGLVK